MTRLFRYPPRARDWLTLGALGVSWLSILAFVLLPNLFL